MKNKIALTGRYLSLGLLLCLLTLASPASAKEMAGPGWNLGEADQVTPWSVYPKRTAKSLKFLETPRIAPEASLCSAVRTSQPAPAEIVELARGLQHDPRLIFDYVHNHIDYVPYYDSLKGAALTLLDKSGTYIDQTSTYKPVSGATYAIVSNFGGFSNDLIAMRRKKLEQALSDNLPETSDISPSR